MPDLGLIEYPLDFPIKVLGKNQPGFQQAVTAIVRHHDPNFDETTMETRPSKKNAYLSFTCVVHAVSREQRDALYMALNEHPLVVMVL